MPAMRKRLNDLERCPEEMGCDLFDSAVQMEWAERLRIKRIESNQRVEHEVQSTKCFRPLGYNKPKGISKIPDHDYKVKSGKHNDGFSSAAFVSGGSIFFRCSYGLSRTEKDAEGNLKHFWRVRNAWFELCDYMATSISEAVEIAAPYISSPHNSDMMMPILRKLKRPYWPLQTSTTFQTPHRVHPKSIWPIPA